LYVQGQATCVCGASGGVVWEGHEGVSVFTCAPLAQVRRPGAVPIELCIVLGVCECVSFVCYKQLLKRRNLFGHSVLGVPLYNGALIVLVFCGQQHIRAEWLSQAAHFLARMRKQKRKDWVLQSPLRAHPSDPKTCSRFHYLPVGQSLAISL
jgi:hypothetical protein